MSTDLEADRTALQSLIALWQDEEKRLCSILEAADTSPLVKQQVTKRLASVHDQVRGLADELDAMEKAN
jgi:hypothetical protein